MKITRQNVAKMKYETQLLKRVTLTRFQVIEGTSKRLSDSEVCGLKEDWIKAEPMDWIGKLDNFPLESVLTSLYKSFFGEISSIVGNMMSSSWIWKPNSFVCSSCREEWELHVSIVMYQKNLWALLLQSWISTHSLSTKMLNWSSCSNMLWIFKIKTFLSYHVRIT